MTEVSPRPGIAERLARMIRIPTVSAELDQRGMAPFDEFLALLGELYPLVHENLELTRHTDLGVLLRWAGRGDAAPMVLMAHFDHYVDRPGDMSLALYLFNGLKPQGLTRELDARLNQQLESIMVVFRQCVQDLAGPQLKDVDSEVGLHYSVLFGLLIFHHTKRTRVFHIDARHVLQMHIQQAIDRLGSAASARPARVALRSRK